MYVDVVSRGEGSTMLVRLSGVRHARAKAPFQGFKDKGRNCPIRGVDNNVPYVSYRTRPKGWMNGKVVVD